MRNMVNLPSCVDDPRQKQRKNKNSNYAQEFSAGEQQRSRAAEHKKMVNDFLWMVHERW